VSSHLLLIPTRLSSSTSWCFHVSSPLLQESLSALFNHFPAVLLIIASAAGVPLGSLQPLLGCFTYHHLCCRRPSWLSSTTSRLFYVSSLVLQVSLSGLFNHYPAFLRVVTTAAGVPLGYIQPIPVSFMCHHICC
jgi:hypothetical protein